MLLNNNNESGREGGGGSVVYRQSRPAKPGRGKNSSGGGGGGTTAARNSWSFVQAAPDNSSALIMQAVSHQHNNKVVENIYADPELLKMEVSKSVSRSRLRQRSVSNLTSAALAGVRARDHSASNRQSNGSAGTVSKGVDYIRLSRPVAQQPTPQIIQDRSEYGNPDGSSAHSTAEREAAGQVSSHNNNKEVLLLSSYDAVIHQQQNQTNHLIHHHHHHQHSAEAGGEAPTLLVSSRSVPAASSASPQPPTTTRGSGSPREVPPVATVRKPHAAAAVSTSSSSGPVKPTEWTFLPSPAGPIEPALRPEMIKPEESSMVRKGLVWMMRDRIFSRYHERFCILTRNYLHCFKKGSEGSLTQMGNFLFKVSLAEVLAVQWLDKRGTAIVCLTLAKEGRLLIKTSLDLTGWFEDLQSCVKETLGRRLTLLHDQQQQRKGGHHLIEATASPVLMRHRQQYVVQPVRDRSLAARNRSNNRYSLMSDHEVKMTGMTAGGAASERSDNGNPTGILAGEQPLSLCYNVPAQMTPPPPPTTTTTTTTPTAGPPPPPVPVPYRERSVSFDRSRVSKAEREAKRRSYYPSNHVTQV